MTSTTKKITVPIGTKVSGSMFDVEINITELHYLDTNGNERVYPVNQKPVVVSQYPFNLVYVTKLNDLRWGAEIIVTEDNVEALTDRKSPITAVSLEVTEL